MTTTSAASKVAPQDAASSFNSSASPPPQPTAAARSAVERVQNATDTRPKMLPGASDPFFVAEPVLRYQDRQAINTEIEEHRRVETRRGQDVNSRSDSVAGQLRITTDFGRALSASPPHISHIGSLNLSPPKRNGPLNHKTSSSSLKQVSRTPSLKAALANSLASSSYGPTSAASSLSPSPIISAMGDMTPLPSPLLSGDSPGPWNKLKASSGSASQPRSRLSTDDGLQDVDVQNGSSTATPSQRKAYGALEHGQQTSPPPGHNRDRSVSEYIPETAAMPKRNVTVSGSHTGPDAQSDPEPHMRREQNLAESRGLTHAQSSSTPQHSESSDYHEDGTPKLATCNYEAFEATGRHDQKRRRWRAVRDLGQGTFSRVVLATSQMLPETEGQDLPDRKSLVAIKLCEHGPQGGASEERVEMSLKRELEILQSIHHPSVVDLKAWSIEPTRAVLVLGYSIGGDLFDVATQHRQLLTPPLMRRIFAELVGAVNYLHTKMIVHRDIKLENVLVNLEPPELANPSIDWTTYPYSVITLTDLGLSRRITDSEKLETRCGSEDYAAPEVIMGRAYDGRATDAWSLGVLLYALLEARLPFDPHPGVSDAHRMRSKTSHRIARIDWRWVEFAGDDGDHEGDPDKFQEQGLLGAMQITEGLLRRDSSRWSLEKVLKHEWVRDAIQVERGPQFWEEQAAEVVE